LSGISTEPAEGILETMFSLLLLGGPVVAILLAMSIVSLAITFLKLYQFSVARTGDRRTPQQALKLYEAGRSREALGLLAHTRNPAARVLALAIRGRMRRDWAESKVREEVARVGRDLLEDLRCYLRPLEVIATLAPLLGLFGTVLGMIEAFRRMEQAGSQVSPAILSGGIWEALLTTAVGLTVAIPTVAILNWLERAVERLGHEMESVVTRVFTGELNDRSGEDIVHDFARAGAPALVPGE
jgi:biopolymer transport protein ExbB